MSEDLNTRAVIVGVDESDGAAEALRWAAAEADLHHVTLTAVMAWGLLDQHHTIIGERFDPTYGEHAATDALRAFVVRALGDDAASTVTARAICDLPARALLDAGGDGDLLVVGARGLGGFRGLLLGSVSQHCLHRTKTPIAIIRPTVGAGLSGRIVVGVDGSPTSHRALRWALLEAHARDAAVDVVHAWHVPYAGHLPYRSMAVGDDGAYEAAAQRVLEKAITAVDPDDAPQLRAVPLRGGATDAILRAAEGADLLVVGTRGHSPLKRLLLGSVATQLAHHAPCPLVVVPPAPSDGPW